MNKIREKLLILIIVIGVVNSIVTGSLIVNIGNVEIKGTLQSTDYTNLRIKVLCTIVVCIVIAVILATILTNFIVKKFRVEESMINKIVDLDFKDDEIDNEDAYKKGTVFETIRGLRI